MLVVTDENKLKEYGFKEEKRFDGSKYYKHLSRTGHTNVGVDMNKQGKFDATGFTYEIQDLVYDMIKDGTLEKVEVMTTAREKQLEYRVKYLEEKLKENSISY